MKTAVTEYLDEQQVPYRLLHHSVPAMTIEEAAKQREILPCQMVKSILLRDMDNNYAMACVPGHLSADPKKVRALLNCRRMTCVPMSEVTTITGYHVGTVTPLLLITEMPVFFDTQFQSMQEVTISSGSNMAGIALDPVDLIRLCNPTFADIVR